MQQWLARTFCCYHPHCPPHRQPPPPPYRPPPHQPTHHNCPPRQEVLAGTERWIRLHDLIIKGELAPDVSSKDIRFDKSCFEHMLTIMYQIMYQIMMYDTLQCIIHHKSSKHMMAIKEEVALV